MAEEETLETPLVGAEEVMTMAEGASNGKTLDKDIIPFGMGTFNQDVVVSDTGAITDAGTVIGATKGGGKFSIVPNLVVLEADARNVLAVGDHQKAGETATMEAPFTELTAADVAKYTLGTVSAGTDCQIVKSSDVVTTGHYFNNVAYIGKSASGKPMIVLFKNGICTSGLEVEGKKAEQGAPTVTIECVADADANEDKLPWMIIWPE